MTNGARQQRRHDILRFLTTIQRPDRALAGLEDGEGLVASGLIDSLSLLQIVVYLEDTYGIDFTTRGIEPEELRSMGSILDLIEREAPNGQ